MFNRQNSLLTLLLFCLPGWVLLCIGCNTSGTTQPSPASVVTIPFTTRTVVNADGTVSSNSTLDSVLVGVKTIFVALNSKETVYEVDVVISWWKAGDRAHNRNVRTVVNASVPANGQRGVNVDLPGSEAIDLCDGFYYMASVNYNYPDGSAAVWVDQPRGFLIEKKYMPDGTLQETQCTNALLPSDR